MKYLIPFLSLLLFTNCFLLKDEQSSIFEPQEIIIPDFPVKTISAWEKSAFFDSLNITKIDSGVVYSSEDWDGLNFVLYQSTGHPYPHHEINYKIWYKSNKPIFKEFQLIIPSDKNTNYGFVSFYNRKHFTIASKLLFDVDEITMDIVISGLINRFTKKPISETEHYFIYSGQFENETNFKRDHIVGFIVK